MNNNSIEEQKIVNVPGFADLHFNGFKGVDFSGTDLTEEIFIKTCREVLNNGITLFLPSIVSTIEEMYERNLRIISNVINMSEFKNSLPGIHIEGPFLST
ncbi:hypothetical protein ACFL6H_09285, partial [Candidatus Latescibacterota bacterium]